ADGAKSRSLLARRRPDHGAQNRPGQRRAENLPAVHRSGQRRLQHRVVAGAMLIHMLRGAPEVFGNPFGDASMAGTVGEPIYDMSIGYDLAGIQTPKVVNFIRGMIDARETVDRLRDQIPRWL